MTIQYAAGFFDGEGCISVGTNRERWKSYQIQVTQLDRRPLDMFQARWGGAVYIKPAHGVGKKNGFQWKIASKGAVKKFLEDVQGHLVVKREKALQVLELLSN